MDKYIVELVVYDDATISVTMDTRDSDLLSPDVIWPLGRFITINTTQFTALPCKKNTVL